MGQRTSGAANGHGGHASPSRWVFVLVVLVFLPVSRASAQGEAFAALVPTELSVGAGSALEWDPARASTGVNVGLSRAWVRDQWIEPALEMGVGPWSSEVRCQSEDLLYADSDNCLDAYVMFGPRFRPLRESDRLWRPFVHFLLGAYWTGSGLSETAFLGSDIAIQGGGGVDLRKPTSIHGVRFSADYRRVFDRERGRHQVQLLVSYFVGWRGRPGGTP